MHRAVALLSVVSFLVHGLVAGGVHASLAQDATAEAGPVATARGDAALSGEHPGPGPEGDPVELWRYEADGFLNPPVGGEGVVYLADSSRSAVVALDAGTGAERWRYQQVGFTMEVEAADGERVYVSGNQGQAAGLPSFAGVLAADTGDERWRFEDPDRWIVDLTAADGTAYVIVGGFPLATLVALDAGSGAERWRVDVPAGAAKPAAADGLLYLPTNDGVLALTADTGAESWRYDAGGRGGAAVVGDGLVVVGGDQGLVALDATSGEVAWTSAPEQPDEQVAARPAIADGSVYVLTGVREPEPVDTLRALDAATGDERWAFAPDDVLGLPAVADGVIYVGAAGSEDDAGALLAVDAATGIERWRFAGSEAMDNAPVVVGGVAYITGEGEGFTMFLHAVGGSESAAGQALRATPAADEDPDGTPDPDAIEGVEGDTYTDPAFGWTLTWDPAVWYPIEDDRNDLFLFSQNGSSRIIFDNSERYGGDVAACVAAVADRQGYEPVLDEAGTPIAGQEPDRAYAVVASGLEAYAIDCRVLDAETVLVISHFVDLPDYPAEAAAVEDLLAGLVIVVIGRPAA